MKKDEGKRRSAARPEAKCESTACFTDCFTGKKKNGGRPGTSEGTGQLSSTEGIQLAARQAHYSTSSNKHSINCSV